MVALSHCFRVVCYAAIDWGAAFFFILVSPEPSRVPSLQQIHLRWHGIYKVNLSSLAEANSHLCHFPYPHHSVRKS